MNANNQNPQDSDTEQPAKTKLFHSQGRLMFGQVREDAAVDQFLVSQIQSPKRLFVIASGGCTALSLLTIDDCTIDALDISQAQIALVNFKATIFKQLGFAAAKDACVSDARSYFQQVSSVLSPQTKQFFEARLDSLKGGLNNCGWVDQRMHQLTNLFYLFVHNRQETEYFLRLDDIEKQRSFYKSKWCNWQWQLTMKVAFSRLFLTLAHGRAAETLVPDDFSRIMEGRLVRAFVDFANAANPYLWQAFFAKYNDREDGLPPYLQNSNGPTIQANIDRLNLVCEDTIDWLRKQPSQSIDYFGLSNILELLPPSYASELHTEIARCARPGALVSVRSIFGRRSSVFKTESVSEAKAVHQADAADAPAALGAADKKANDAEAPTALGHQCQLVLDKGLSDKAEQMDRSLFCNFYEIYRCKPQ